MASRQTEKPISRSHLKAYSNFKQDRMQLIHCGLILLLSLLSLDLGVVIIYSRLDSPGRKAHQYNQADWSLLQIGLKNITYMELLRRGKFLIPKKHWSISPAKDMLRPRFFNITGAP